MNPIAQELRGFAEGSTSARATLMRDAAKEIDRLETLAEGRRALGLNAIFMAEIIDSEAMAAAREDYLASFAEAFVADAFDAGETTLEALVARARRIREKP